MLRSAKTSVTAKKNNRGCGNTYCLLKAPGMSLMVSHPPQHVYPGVGTRDLPKLHLHPVSPAQLCVLFPQHPHCAQHPQPSTTVSNKSTVCYDRVNQGKNMALGMKANRISRGGEVTALRVAHRVLFSQTRSQLCFLLLYNLNSDHWSARITLFNFIWGLFSDGTAVIALQVVRLASHSKRGKWHKWWHCGLCNKEN